MHDATRAAAIQVLRHNLQGRNGLPRTAAWGYPEPYTRDLAISTLGVLCSDDPDLMEAWRRVLVTLAEGQTRHGHIPSLVDDRTDYGSSDTTPLFLVACGAWQKATGETDFLAGPCRKALRWLAFQSPDDSGLVDQAPTSDWRDEQWVPGFGLYVNALVCAAYGLHGRRRMSRQVRALMRQPCEREKTPQGHRHEGFRHPTAPYLCTWTYKVLRDEGFDLLGNSLAVLTGILTRPEAGALFDWVARQSHDLRARGLLQGPGLPCFFPYVEPGGPGWHERYARFNQPGTYHNGGIWPYVQAIYVAALMAGGRPAAARTGLDDLTALVRQARRPDLQHGFNEWHRAQDGRPMGEDWQTWSAALYLFAWHCVAHGRLPAWLDTGHSGPRPN